VVRDNTVTLKFNVGPVPVRFAPDGLFGEMTQRDPEFGPKLDAREVARLIGVEEYDLTPAHAPQIVSTGNAFAIVVLRSAEPLARLRVDHDQATAWLRERGARWFYVLGPETNPDKNEAVQWRARMQWEGGEDPATGSAAGCAIGYLVGRGIVDSGDRIRVRQGIEMGRESHLFLSAKLDSARVTDVRVGGSTVPVANGRLFLP